MHSIGPDCTVHALQLRAPMDYRDTPRMNDALENLAYEIERDEEFPMGAVTYERGKGWIVMVVGRDGRVHWSDRMERRNARALLQRVAELVNTTVFQPKTKRFEQVVGGETMLAKRAKARPAIPVDLRWEILERDKHRCGYCGASGEGVILHVDHRVPVAKGGPTERDNLVTACRDCNLGKRDTLLVE